MSSVRSTGTRLEENFAKSLRRAKLGRFERNPRNVAGRPDFIFRKQRVAIFVDSCFWHGCRWHCRMPAANANYWRAKIARNRRRDKQVNRLMQRDQWRVVRVWEHSLKNEGRIMRTLDRIEKALE
jgi:DNA mismatch endonuclease (patch repair protein)